MPKTYFPTSWLSHQSAIRNLLFLGRIHPPSQQPASRLLFWSVDRWTCDGNFGSIATNITGGHAPYRLYYDGPISQLQRENSGLTQSNGATLIQNLTPGSYTFTVIDAEMCTVNQTITVNGP